MATPTPAAGVRPYPFSQARATGAAYPALLAAILAAGTLDEISAGSREADAGIEPYIRGRGFVDRNSNRTRCGVIFWLYPTGLHGPYRTDENGELRQHGTLITIEPGADVNEAAQQARQALRRSGIGHVHIRGTGFPSPQPDSEDEEQS
ncbi:hypothetical protein EST38_g4436 [Candolleomyces aberdarensis]|uniref:Uncharacterized protein n=1 Tax=Candolleomyces aberdarensis TaxID=2316362 RepID=A0A4Q2DN08_9AGAR|nr:hypothetical protein EST38_g4436 [Candolleomyces aberdarensis]